MRAAGFSRRNRSTSSVATVSAWSAAITTLIGILTRFLTGEIAVAGALSEGWTVLLPLAISALRLGVSKSSTPAPTPTP